MVVNMAEVSKEARPELGQQCECVEHLPDEPHEELERVFRFKGGKPCYEWWCSNCYESTEPLEDEYPIDDAIHCPMIPGLD